MSTLTTIFTLLLIDQTRRTLCLDKKIYNGHDCDILKNPYYAYIELKSNNDEFVCGGSLIKPDTVLTAGHCCEGTDSAQIFTGYYKEKKVHDQLVMAKTPFIFHPKFDSASLSHDLCLIKLKSHLKITEKTKLVSLASKEEIKHLMDNKDENKNFTLDLMGYGINSKDKDGYFMDEQKPLQCTSTILKTQKHCLDLMGESDKNSYDAKTMFCHYNPAKTVKGSCEGDSGSPVMYKGKQVGLISWGLQKETCTVEIDVAGRLDHVLDWIKTT